MRRIVILIEIDVRGEGEVVHQATVGLEHRVRRFDLFNVIASLALTILGQPVSWFVCTLGHSPPGHRWFGSCKLQHRVRWSETHTVDLLHLSRSLPNIFTLFSGKISSRGGNAC